MDRAIDFYVRQLGLHLRTRIGGEWAEIDAGRGLIIGLHPARPPETVRAGTVGAINIELSVTKPLEQVIDELTARDVKFATSIQEYPAVRLLSTFDPDNNVILLAQILNS
jgi:hypothetical protein